jgi:putative transposase
LQIVGISSDAEWEIIRKLFSQGNKSSHHKRSLVDVVLYIENTGYQWRQLPHDYPPFSTVWSFLRRERASGLWEKACSMLVEKTRVNAGRKAYPSYGIIGSQSAKAIAASEDRGFDGGKKISYCQPGFI